MLHKDLLQLDHENAVGADTKPPTPDSLAAAREMYHYLAVEPDARRAEFLATMHPELVLPAIRSHLLRGNLDSAEQKLKELALSADEITQSEVKLESARLSGSRGHWQDCLRHCNEGLEMRVSAITHLSLLQCRSVALFEFGALRQSLNDVEMVLSQARYFPHAVAIGFAEVLKIKILARLEGVASVQPLLESAWKSTLKEKHLNLDQVLALFRLEIDLRRLENTSYLPFAIAALNVATTLGDRCYEGLAMLDLVLAIKQPAIELLTALDSFEQEFERVRRMHAEATAPAEEGKSLSGLALRFSKPVEFGAGRVQAKWLLLPGARKLIDLSRPKAWNLSEKLAWWEGLGALGEANVGKAEFFERVWRQRYSNNLHDGVLRTFCHRLRQRYKLNLNCREHSLEFEDLLVLRDFPAH